MTDIDGIYKAIDQDPALRQTLADLAKQDFSAGQIADALKAANLEIEPEQVEGALQEYQKKRAEQIAFENVDPDQLGKVAGGTGRTDCDDNFKTSGFENAENCAYSRLCDEYYEWEVGICS